MSEKENEKNNSAVEHKVPEQPPVEPTAEVKADAAELDSKDLAEKKQNLSVDISLGLSEMSEGDASELYRLGSLIGTNSKLSATINFRPTWPKGKRRDDAVVFNTEQEKDFSDNLTNILEYTTPNNLGEHMLTRTNCEWGDGFLGSDNKIRRPRSHAKSATGVLAAIRRAKNTGAPITLFLPHTGIYLTFCAPSEADYCDYDLSQTFESARIGMATYGMLLSTSSGVYLKHQIRWCLNYVTDTTYDFGDGELVQSLLLAIDPRDYGVILCGPTIAKFPGGIPWSILCPDGNCGEVEEFNLNLSRSIRTDRNAFSPLQREYALKTGTGTVSEKDLEIYKEEFKARDHIITDDSNGYRIEVEFCFRNLHSLFTKTDDWVAELTESTADALGNAATEHERDSALKRRSETRRLTRYAHHVKAIRVYPDPDDNDEFDEDTSYDKIVINLAELSCDRIFVNKFEEAYREFVASNTHTLLAYRETGCKRCGKDHPDTIEEGAFRGLVPISPDRVFFGLSQVIFTIQERLSQEFAPHG